MMIISYAWTVAALVSGRKTATRRDWMDEYARKFKAGDFVQAYDRSPRVGGQRVAIIQLTCDPYKERLGDMTDEEEKAEGGLWGSAREFVRAYGKDPDHKVWVIRFQLVEVYLMVFAIVNLREALDPNGGRGSHIRNLNYTRH